MRSDNAPPAMAGASTESSAQDLCVSENPRATPQRDAPPAMAAAAQEDGAQVSVSGMEGSAIRFGDAHFHIIRSAGHLRWYPQHIPICRRHLSG